jgi:hypothetical protein
MPTYWSDRERPHSSHTCRLTGKAIRSHRAAKRALRGRRETGDWGSHLYRCEGCNGWHLGTQEGQRIRARERARRRQESEETE